MKLISADALRETMYHKAFETDTDMQKWDGGCWIRYKMFENALENEPTIDAEPVVRCIDCKYLQWNMRQDGSLPLGVDEYECRHWCGCCDPMDFCSYGERREE